MNEEKIRSSLYNIMWDCDLTSNTVKDVYLINSGMSSTTVRVPVRDNESKQF